MYWNNSYFYLITVIMMMQLVTKSTHENTIPEVFPSNWFLSNACYMIWHDFSIHLLDVATMISFIVTVSAYVGRKKYVQFPIVNTCIIQIWVIYFTVNNDNLSNFYIFESLTFILIMSFNFCILRLFRLFSRAYLYLISTCNFC